MSNRRVRKVHEAAGEYIEHDWPVEVNGTVVWIKAAKFDVLQLPSPDGARLAHALMPRCPIATIRKVRFRWGFMPEQDWVRWLFCIQSGMLDPEKVEAHDGSLSRGEHSLVPVPPSKPAADIYVGWVVPPQQVRWKPYERADVFDALGLTG